MNFADHYSIKLDTLMSIPPDKVLHPGPEPVHVFLQEAVNLYHASLDDMEILLSGGLRRELVEDLPARISALREAEGIWIASQIDDAQTKSFRAKKTAEALSYRERLLRTLRFVHGDTQIIMRLYAAARRDKSSAALVQSLCDLAAAGRELMPGKPDSIITAELLDEAVEKAADLAKILACGATEKLAGSRELNIRNRAYTHLREAVDEVRRHGKFVFHEEPVKKKRYSSDYMRKARRRSEAKKLKAKLMPAEVPEEGLSTPEENSARKED
jgi:hypothetical protein